MLFKSVLAPLVERRFVRLPVVPVALVTSSVGDASPSRLHLAPSQGSAGAMGDGVLVEARDATSKRLLGFGFVNTRFQSVDVVETVAPSARLLPQIDEHYFQMRLLEKIDSHTLPPFTSSCRVLNGQSDIVAGLYVDRFSSAHARLIATNRGAESLLPLCIETLTGLGAEEMVVFSPSTGCCRARVGPAAGYCRNPVFTELGLSYPWPGRSQISDEELTQNYFSLALRQARLALFSSCAGKYVCCLNCPEETAVLCATSATRSLIAHTSSDIMNRVREVMLLNFGRTGINSPSSTITLADSLSDAHGYASQRWDVVVVHLDSEEDIFSPRNKDLVGFLIDLLMRGDRRGSGHGVNVVILCATAPCGVLEWNRQSHSSPSHGPSADKNAAAAAARIREGLEQLTLTRSPRQQDAPDRWTTDSIGVDAAYFMLTLKFSLQC